MAPKIDGMSSESSEESSSGGGSSSSRQVPKNTEEYRKRRERNNQAVKKSRLKTKMKTQQMMDRVSQLRSENEELEESIKILNKELGILKDLFLAHAGNAHGMNLNEDQLTQMLSDDHEIKEGVNLLMSLAKGSPPKAPYQ